MKSVDSPVQSMIKLKLGRTQPQAPLRTVDLRGGVHQIARARAAGRVCWRQLLAARFSGEMPKPKSPLEEAALAAAKQAAAKCAATPQPPGEGQSKSQHTGVCVVDGTRWRAQIRLEGSKCWLGSFASEQAATVRASLAPTHPTPSRLRKPSSANPACANPRAALVDRADPECSEFDKLVHL
eukprot:COSAG02_NODE_860_length_16430_cov_39.045741_12_plen_182_part_00